MDGDFFSHWYHGEPDLCGSRSYQIFPHRLPQLSLLELWGRRLRRSLRCNGAATGLRGVVLIIFIAGLDIFAGGGFFAHIGGLITGLLLRRFWSSELKSF